MIAVALSQQIAAIGRKNVEQNSAGLRQRGACSKFCQEALGLQQSTSSTSKTKLLKINFSVLINGQI